MNSPRLIPVCLGATSFLVALSIFNWHGKPGAQVLQAQAQGTTRQLTATATAQGEFSPPAAGVPEQWDEILTPQVLPLPLATPPDPDLDTQAVADDAPTVEDLPPPHNPRETVEDP